MNILIDGLVFQNDYQRGIQRLFREVLTRIGNSNAVTLWNEFSVLSDLPENCRVLGPDLRCPPRRWQIAARTKRAVIRALRFRGAPAFDLFCSTYYTRDPYGRLPEVVMVYDMIHEQFVHSQPNAESMIAQKREAIKSAQLCIAISQATADEVKAFYPEIAGRVRVVHPGSEHLISVGGITSEERIDVPQEKFVLFVGSRNNYKNFREVLEAMATVAWPLEVKLAIVGKPLTSGEWLWVRRCGLAARVLEAGEVSDGELSHWYRQSLGFIFPSQQEGFGFPSLEAQSCGAPVACTDNAIFREICGQSALYFDPRSPDSIGSAIRKLLSVDERHRLRELGMENIRRFSWDRCAKLTMAAFEEVLSPEHQSAAARGIETAGV